MRRCEFTYRSKRRSVATSKERKRARLTSTSRHVISAPSQVYCAVRIQVYYAEPFASQSCRGVASLSMRIRPRSWAASESGRHRRSRPMTTSRLRLMVSSSSVSMPGSVPASGTSRATGRSHRIVQEPIGETDGRFGSLKQVPEAIRGFPVWAGNAAR
jgi:hypothetical protein